MPLLLIKEIAKHLDSPTDDVSNALSELVNNVLSDVDNNQPSHIQGVGTFERVGDEILFEPAETLAMAVNNRYAALDAEMVQLGFEEPEFLLSETQEEGNDQEIDQSLIDEIIADDMASQGLFTDSYDSNSHQGPAEEQDPFDGDLVESELDNTNSPLTDELSSQPEVENASMKEDDPNPKNPSKHDPLGSDTEWSPFFEELEGEEFDIDNTIDLSADDWQSEIPTPPSSPFAYSSDSSNTNADDLYFDVDADPDDTLFAPAASIDVENPTSDDLSWASAPLDDVTDFFEDDPSMSSSFGEEADILSALSAEDEFFSPVSGSINASPDDTMFSADSIYSEDASTEADDSIFLAPDQSILARAEQDTRSAFAPRNEVNPPPPVAAPPPRSRNPYAYQDEKKKETSTFPWIAAVVGAVLVISAGLAYWQGWIPLGGNNASTPPQNITSAPPEETPPSDVDPLDTPGTGNEAGSVASAGAEQPAQTQITAPTTPTIQRIGIDRSRGGWTIIVTSKEQRGEAERIADDFAEKLGGPQFPIDILTTNDFANTRYRVGIGQFSSKNEATNFIQRSGADMPEDAWLLRIE